jgi:hypothetical protein
MNVGRLALSACTALLLSGCTGSVIPREFLTNGTADFDFRRPSCTAAFPAIGPSEVGVRYLGSGGAAIQWRGDVLLLGPYFSHTGGVGIAQFGHVHFDRNRIGEGLQKLDHVTAIVTGHSHIDHLGDVPVVAGEYATKAAILTNETGRNLLAAYPELSPRVVAVDHIRDWIDVGTSMRILPVPSDHAPQLCRLRHRPCTYADCFTTTPETRHWEQVPMRELCGGQTFAYVIDLLDARRATRFRIYYNDSTPREGVGGPPPDLQPAHRYDLAILCLASYTFVHAYPEWLLGRLTPRHVMLSHYDDFFTKERTPSWSFVPMLTDAKAKRFMERLRKAMESVKDPAGPSNQVCGPSTNEWSMPIPGATVVFPAAKESAP